MHINTCDDIIMALAKAPIDTRTGNKTVYAASWTADKKSMIGKRNEDWVRREINWFVSGSNSLDDMEMPVPKAFQDCAGEDNTVNSAYGHILFDGGQDSLFARAVKAFRDEGIHTRHSVAIISDRDIHRMATENGRNDFICTNALNFMVDDDNKVHIIVQMRSMDAVWGYRADYSMWDILMQFLLIHLAEAYGDIFNRGDITFQVANLHVYPRHFEALEQEAESIHEMIDRRQWRKSA